jgi:hypothetical protein
MEQTAFGVPTDETSKEHWKEAVKIVVRIRERASSMSGFRSSAASPIATSTGPRT